MNKNLLKNVLVLSALIFVLILPYFVFAQEVLDPWEGDNPALDRLRQVAHDRGPYGEVDSDTVAQVLGLAVSGLMGLLGIIFIILMIYGGYNWMTAAGDENKVATAKKTLYRAVIGLILVAGSFAIYNFIFRAILSR